MRRLSILVALALLGCGRAAAPPARPAAPRPAAPAPALDARRPAEKDGNDPAVWEDVAYWLIRKSKRSVYGNRVVKHGFARGIEPVRYVDLILQRYGQSRGALSE